VDSAPFFDGTIAMSYSFMHHLIQIFHHRLGSSTSWMNVAAQRNGKTCSDGCPAQAVYRQQAAQEKIYTEEHLKIATTD
jgi:hypothetical protein